MKLPDDFVKKYQNLLGTDAPDFLKSFQNEATHGFRINSLKANKQQVDESLERPITNVKNGYYGKVNGHSIDHISGMIYSQDPSAMNVAQYANPQSNDKVLDLCAAPGGKTTQLAALMNNQGLLVANEINSKRAQVLSFNVERLGIKNTLVTNNSPKDLEKIYPNYFDKIVVDAPCSGEGLFRKDPNAMQYWSLDYEKECANRQREILKSAMKLLKVGGTLTYSTCTFAPEEDEQNINWLSENYAIKILPLKHYESMDKGRPEWSNNNPDLVNAVRLFPNHYKGEGHFICSIKKIADDEVKMPDYTPRAKKIASSDQQLLMNFLNNNLVNVSLNDLFVNKNTLYEIVQSFRKKSPKQIRNGLKLGEFKKNRFVPDHALVLALANNQFQHVIDLKKEEFESFVHGNVVQIANPSNFKGWVGVSYENKVFSWGRVVQKQLKNFYPKGLRV